MKNLLRLIAAACMLFTASVQADQMLIVRSAQNFEEAMSTLQASISAHGYKVGKVQRVDVGLEAKGYKTDRYRVVFYAKPGELEALTQKYPTLIPYLPHNVAIFAEGGQTILATARPGVLKEYFPQAELAPIIDRWEKDLVSILDDVRETR